MIGALIVVSVLSALQFVRVFDRSPREQQLAWEITSVINLTRVALVNTRADGRLSLLATLAREEGVRVTPLEASDRVESIADAYPREASFSDSVQAQLRHLLGAETRLAARVNDEPGLWVSFDIDGDPYWLTLKRERFERQLGPNWWLIGLVTLALSAAGAILISRLVNRPLARLAAAIERVSRGVPPEVLPEGVPSEIAQVNQRFNRMATDLAAIESDRAVALAGISHDVRTPLSRLRMEIELSPLSEHDKESMSSEIERIDQIVGKFLDYARTGQSELDRANLADFEIGELLEGVCERHRGLGDHAQVDLQLNHPLQLRWHGDSLDLERVLINLLENARRYGRSPDDGRLRLKVSAAAISRVRPASADNGIVITVRDHGPGVNADQLDTLLRPFSRADEARSYEGGSGLGLTIVDRIARRYRGGCELTNAPAGGLQVTVTLFNAAEPPRDQ